MQFNKASILRKSDNLPICTFMAGSVCGHDVRTQACLTLLSMDLSHAKTDPVRIYEILAALHTGDKQFIEELLKDYVVVEDQEVKKLNNDQPLSVSELLGNS